MRTGANFKVSAEQCRQIEAIANDGNSRQKYAAHADHPAVGQGLGKDCDHGQGRGVVEGDGLALAEAVHGGGREGLLRDKKL